MKKQNAFKEPALGIILTLGQVIIDANGGLKSFVQHFENCCRDENSGYWLQKAARGPVQDIGRIYLVVCNRIYWRAYYGGYEKESNHHRTVWMLNGEERLFPWPHIRIAGPLEKAPNKIPMRGFQGFRYITKDLW